jgi:pimeloyl-ACP methyl ester carboxylesterase
MDRSAGTPFAPARLIALALIALLVGGLVALRFGGESDLLAVPDGAEAGDLTLESCEYATESGTYQAECGTLVVAETRGDPQSRLIVLPVLRVRAETDAPQEPVFFLTGGPGESNLEFASQFANRYIANRDFVAIGYRGAEGSVRLDCPEVSSALKHSTDLVGDDFFRASADGYRSCATRLAAEGVDLTSYGLVQQVDDMEVARVALGYDRINLLSESAGTRTAMIYAWRYPESIHRSVMVAVNPPAAFLLDAEATDEQIGRYSGLCAEDSSCRGRTGDLAGTLRRISADVPDRWLFLPIKDGNVRVVSLFGLLDTTAAASETPAPMTLDAWLDAADGDASGLWFTSVLGDLLFPDMFIWGQYAGAAMLDAQAARESFAGGPGNVENLGRSTTAFAWGGGGLADARPAAPEEDEYRRVRTSQVETLLVGGELDPMTPPQVATKQLLPHLPNGHQVVLPGFGHTLSVLMEQPEAGSRLINTFFHSGQVDDSLYVPVNVDFTPPMTFRTMAKIALAALLGLAALTALSLLAMARRVHRRGHIGLKSSALLRSVYAPVLGLGGWFLGVLIVLTAMPAVRIDNELLIVLFVSAPVGLGIYLGWVHRGWPAATKRSGGAAAGAAALGGAWLGFHAAPGPLALLTAIAGAVAGGNLALLVYDMWTARSAKAPPPAAPVDGEPAMPARIGMP